MKVSMLAALIAVVAGVLGLNAAARADFIYFDYSAYNGSDFGNAGTISVGSEFTVGSYPVHLTEVGQYWQANPTLPVSSHVELWTTTGSELMDWTIPAGTTVSSDLFAWLPVTPYLLAANTTYVLSSFGENLFNSNPTDGNFPTTDITYVGRRFNQGGTDVFPDTFFAVGDGFVDMGPSFQYATPEPASMAMLAAGGVMLLKRRRA